MLDGCTSWPAHLAATYRAKGYWSGETLGAHLKRWATMWPDTVAIAAPGEHLTYADLDLQADALASHLVNRGLGDRDRIVVQLTNSPRFFTLLFACLRTGVIPVLALPAHRESEIVHFASHARARAYAVPGASRYDYLALARTVRNRVPSVRHVFVDADDAGDFESLPRLSRPRVAPARTDDSGTPDDVALFLLSGGTSGQPKLIPRTHDDYAYNFRGSAALAGFDRDTRYLVALPVAHNFPLGSPGALGTFEHGGTVVLTDDLTPAGALGVIERERITHTSVVPTVAFRWLEHAAVHGMNQHSLRVLQVGGARLGDEIARKVRPILGCRLQQVFGMAEGLLNYTRLDDDDETIVSSQGRPMSPDDEVRLVDDEGRDVPDGLPGELLTRGPYTIRGYYQAVEHNGRAFTADGFYRSGDVVTRRPGGHLVVEGRTKDLINRGGEKISAEEVESHLRAHPRVRDIAVVAMADREYGERACAFVVVRDGAPLALPELVAFLGARGIAKFMYPERVETIEALPVTHIGKIDKASLRRMLAG